MGFGLVAPVLPIFAARFDVGVTAASVVVSAFAFLRLIFAPASGRLVTRFGERRVYVSGLVIVAASTGACAFAQAYWQLLLFRSSGGIGSTMFTVSALALLVRLSPPHLRGRASGLWATGFLMGSISGPLLGGGLVEISLRLPFLAYGVAVLLAALLAWLFLRGPGPAAPPPADPENTITVLTAWAHRAYRAALSSGFATGWAVFGVRVSLIPLFVTEALHASEGFAGLSLSIFAAGNVAALTVSGRLADKYGRRPMVIYGLAVTSAGTIWLGFTDTEFTFLAASLIAGVGSGMLSPAQQAAVADVIGPRGGGGPVLAAFQMATDVGAILGPLLTGVIAEVFSYPMAFGLTGLISVLALLVWLTAPETRPATTPAMADD
jgi:MFS family permease